MTNIKNEYRALVASLLQSGQDKDDRTGIGTKSLFGKQIVHNMELGFPLLTGKKMYFNHVVVELLWILQGRTDMGYLHENNVHYWDDDYKRSGRKDGTLGPVYGAQWRNFNGYDQLMELIYNISINPSSRRHIINAWAPHKLKNMVLPPCHYAMQVNINNNKMDLLWVQRSADVFLGLPYDIAMYGLLLELLCHNTEYKPGKLIAQLGDCHLYNNHLEAANEFIYREDTSSLPTIKISGDGFKFRGGRENPDVIIPKKKHIQLINYKPLPPIKAKLNVGK